MTLAPRTKITLNDPEVTLRLVLSGAEQIAERLRVLTSTMGPSSLRSQFYTRVRAKTLDSIRDKIVRNQRGLNRKNERLPNYSFRDLTDAVGFRVVTLYEQELKDALNDIVGLIVAGQNLRDPLFAPGFVWDRFESALFIMRPEADPYKGLLDHLRDRIRADCKEHRVAARSYLKQCNSDSRETIGGYSSAHMVFYGKAYIGGFEIELPVEAQLRTAAEDIWSEINHKLLYKINTSLTWSHGYETRHAEASGISRVLKDKIDELTPLIHDFYRAYADAGEELDLWAAEKQHRYHFSFILSLLIAMGDPGQDLLHLDIYDDFDIYEFIVERLQRASDDNDKLEGRQAIADAIVVMRRVIKKFDDRRTPSKQTPLGMLNTERRALCELEILRLKALAILYFAGRVTNKTEKHEGVHQEVIGEKEIKDTLMSVYAEFCEYLERPLSTRPQCVIMYFKYLLAARLDTARIAPFAIAPLAKENLISSYELIKAEKDRTLPPYSIYRVLLPRALAEEQVKDVEIILADIGRNNPLLPMMNAIRRTLQDKLIDALKYAIRAGNEHLTELNNPRRGDILFGYGPNEAVHDLRLIIHICEQYKNHFEGLSFHDKMKNRMLDAEQRELQNCIRELMKATSDAELHKRAEPFLHGVDT